VKLFPDPVRKALEAKEITIDVMLLYKLAIEMANYTFRNNGLGNIALHLVHSQEIEFDETGQSQFDV